MTVAKVDDRRMVFALAAVRYREDDAGLAALLWGGEDPVDERALLLTALDVLAELASAQGSEEIPSAGGEEVLRRWCLEAAG